MKSQQFFLLILFVVTVLLSSCDAVSLPYLTVDRIAIENGSVFIHVSEYYSFGVSGYGTQKDHYFSSNDYGKSWEEIPSPLFEMPIPVELLEKDQFEPPYDVQSTICSSNNSKICYRIAGKEQVEISCDGGQSWEIDWKMPLGRNKFMERNPQFVHLLRVKPDIIPYDIGIVPRGDEHFAIVAMGNQGVLVKSPNGSWDRYAVETSSQFPMLATPLPFYAKNLRDALQSLIIEITWASLATIIFFIVLSYVGWKNIRINEAMGNPRKKIDKAYIPIKFAVAGSIFLILLSILDFFSSFANDLFFNLFFQFIIPGYICIVPVIGAIISWLLFIAYSRDRKCVSIMAFFSLIYSFAFFVGIILVFIFWAFGIIPVYEIALSIAVIIGVFTVVMGVRSISKAPCEFTVPR